MLWRRRALVVAVLLRLDGIRQRCLTPVRSEFVALLTPLAATMVTKATNTLVMPHYSSSSSSSSNNNDNIFVLLPSSLYLETHRYVWVRRLH